MGRANHIDGLYARLGQKDVRCEAFEALNSRAQVAIFLLSMNYWESGHHNPLTLTKLWLADYLRCDPKTATKVLDDLESHWWLEVERLGRLTGPNDQRGARYRMSWLPTSEGQPASNHHRKWTAAIIFPGEGRKGPSTGASVRLNGGEGGVGRGKLSPVSIPLRRIADRLEAQRQQGKSKSA